MFISKIKVKNFRHLKDSTLLLDSEKNQQLSLLIGRNNSGKTSFLVLLEKFYSGKQFDFYDFPLSLRDNLLKFNQETNINDLAIQLIIEIKYTQEDSLENLSSFILDLVPDIFQANLLFECTINKKKLLAELEKTKQINTEKFIQNNINNFLETKVYAFEKEENLLPENKELNLVLRDIKDVHKLINLHIIHAKRNVSSSDSDIGKGAILSQLAMAFYNRQTKNEAPELNAINQSIAEMDSKLNDNYEIFFHNFLEKAKNVLALENLCVISDLESKQIVGNFSKVIYGNPLHSLPETLSGLGYLNILYLLLQIEIIEKEYASDIKEINLLIIEEPEAHTHPQMQYVFIKEIKKIIESIPTLQVLLTTHSSHIVSQCDFRSIRYFKINTSFHNIEIKNFYTELKNKYQNDNEQFKFLTQYLTLYSAELFFAEKVIFIEGETEKLLLPLFIRQFDKENSDDNLKLPLGSQNITIIEVGTNAKAFSHFLTFFDIKTLIITDIDTVKLNEEKKEEACAVNDKPENTSNENLKHYLRAPSRPSLSDRKNQLEQEQEQKFQEWLGNLLSGNVTSLNENNIRVTYQLSTTIADKTYHARSFEDAFIFENQTNLKKHLGNILGLKNKTELNNIDTSKKDVNYYKLTKDIIDSKTMFALSLQYIALTQDDNDICWTIPHYIKEGLKWIQD